MYGKSYESKFEGSMVGAGIAVFAVWDYMTTYARDGYVEVNPKLLAFTLGGRNQDPQEIVAALEFLQQPDPTSRSQEEGGRRVIKEGQFQYRLVNWAKYNKIRTEVDRREYNRMKQAEYRAAKKSPSSLTLREQVNRSVENDPLTKQDQKELRRLSKGKPPGSNPIQPGLVTDTETLGQMVGEYGEDNPGEDLLPDERRQRVQEKIAREGAACERVRAKMNPKYAIENQG